jgi:ADP-ribose pyrophosphatase YjhB (NUDIX family)
MKHYHPRKNDHDGLVEIAKPSQPTTMATWDDATAVATAVPDSPMPEQVCGIPVCSWSDRPSNPQDWEAMIAGCQFAEPPFKANGKKPASGGVILEDDGRVWIVSPSNQFGGYTHTFPKGQVIPKDSLSLRANAVKEVAEETGLRVELTGFLADSDRSTTTTRYYLARRISGNPADMDWETQAVNLVPRASLEILLNHKNDKKIVDAFQSCPALLIKSQIIKYEFGLMSGERILATISAYRHRFGMWPTRLLIDQGMVTAVKEKILTPLGWEMLTGRIKMMRCVTGTLFAEGPEGRIEYGNHSFTTQEPRPDVWIWGIQVI